MQPEELHKNDLTTVSSFSINFTILLLKRRNFPGKLEKNFIFNIRGVIRGIRKI